jgi:hypothetical protein
MWRFGHDITELALCNDTKRYDELGYIPPYIQDYLAHVYGGVMPLNHAS